MSIALERNCSDSIKRPVFTHGVPCISDYDSPEEQGLTSERRLPSEREDDSDSCSSSSIGRNSDASGGSLDGEDSAEAEVQSSFKGPLDTIDDLEEVLPIRRGISKFYNGKSRSFTSLADAAAASSVKDFAKPENPYTRKRKNLLAHSASLNKIHSLPLINNLSEISKRPANTNRSKVASEVTVISSEGNYSEESNLKPSSSSCCLPPLHPQCKKLPNIRSSLPPPRANPPCRSFSLSDLQCVAAATSNIAGLAGRSGDKGNKLH